MNAMGFEVIKVLLQLVIAGIVGKILADRYNEGREKEKVSNQFRKDLLDVLVKAYYKAKKARRILRANTISDNMRSKIIYKVYEEQMRDINDAQLALEYYKFQLVTFPGNIKTHATELTVKAEYLETI